MPEETKEDDVKKEEPVATQEQEKKQRVRKVQKRSDTENDAQAKSEGETAEAKKPNADYEDIKLFGKYPVSGILVEDMSIVNYIRFNRQEYPNIFGRRKYQSYYNTHSNIVERLANKLMRGGTGKKIGGRVIRTEGRLQGKKMKVMRIVKDAFDTISKKTGNNPVQVLVYAIENAAPIEDATRVRYGGISYNVAVGISANRRVDVALKNIALASLISAFNKRRKLADALAEELILASQKSPESYAIKKRTELERIAKRAR